MATFLENVQVTTRAVWGHVVFTLVGGTTWLLYGAVRLSTTALAMVGRP